MNLKPLPSSESLCAIEKTLQLYIEGFVEVWGRKMLFDGEWGMSFLTCQRIAEELSELHWGHLLFLIDLTVRQQEWAEVKGHRKAALQGARALCPWLGTGYLPSSPLCKRPRRRAGARMRPVTIVLPGREWHWVATRKVTARNRLARVDTLFPILLFGQFSFVPQFFSIAHTEGY